MLTATVSTCWISYSCLNALRFVGAGMMVALFVLAVARSIGLAENPDAWRSDACLLGLLLFWALFPPSWFFTEYFLIDRDFVYLSVPVDGNYNSISDYKSKVLEDAKTYADYASKVWAAAAAVLGVVLMKK